MYLRDPETLQCKWDKHPKTATIGVLNRHGPNMVSLLLNDAVNKLYNGTFIRDYTKKRAEGVLIKPDDRLPCVYLNSNNNILIIHYDEDAIFYAMNYDKIPLRVEYMVIDDVFACPDEDRFIQAISDLRQSINNRTDEVLNELKSLMIDEKVLIKFLHSIQPMKRGEEPRILLE